MAHRDEIAFANKQMRLAKRNPAVDQLRRPRHDEQAFAVLFDFRPLMGVVGIFNREAVQAELSRFVASLGIDAYQTTQTYDVLVCGLLTST